MVTATNAKNNGTATPKSGGLKATESDSGKKTPLAKRTGASVTRSSKSATRGKGADMAKRNTAESRKAGAGAGREQAIVGKGRAARGLFHLLYWHNPKPGADGCGKYENFNNTKH